MARPSRVRPTARSIPAAAATAELKVPVGRVKIVNGRGETSAQNTTDGTIKVTLKVGAVVYVLSE